MNKREQLPAPTGHHNLILEDRAKLTLTGVTDVDCFDERMINLFTGLGELTIKGRNLHINDVSVETGDMTITGDIWLLQYWEKKFWLTEFSHLGGDGNPTRSNLVLVTKAARDMPFNLDELKPLNNMKLKDILT